MAEVQDTYDVKRAVMLLEPLGWKLIEEWYFSGDVLIQFAKPATEVPGAVVAKSETG